MDAGGVADVAGTPSPMGLQGKHKQAIYASGLSSSSGGEEWRPQDQQEEIKKLRARVADCKKKLEEQKKSLQRQLRDIEKFARMDPVFKGRQKEIWKNAEKVTKSAEIAG